MSHSSSSVTFLSGQFARHRHNIARKRVSLSDSHETEGSCRQSSSGVWAETRSVHCQFAGKTSQGVAGENRPLLRWKHWPGCSWFWDTWGDVSTQGKVNQQQSIIALHERGWSGRRIARELGLDRGTVGKYLAVNSKSATNPQTGSGGTRTRQNQPLTRKPARPVFLVLAVCVIRGRSRSKRRWSGVCPSSGFIRDLVVERQFAGSYFSVRRFVLRRVDAQELPFRRIECAPAQELQVDFGLGAWVMENGKRRRPHLPCARC